MTFDSAYKPNRDNLSSEIAAMMDRAFYSRRAKGFNVQFVNELGQKDEWSFNCRERAEAFAEALAKKGTESAFSA